MSSRFSSVVHALSMSMKEVREYMLQTYLLLGVIGLNFILLTKGTLKPQVGMTLTGIAAVILAGPQDGVAAIRNGFEEFSTIAVLFTAIAVPAHMLVRSGALHKLGMQIGELIGKVVIRFKVDRVPVVLTVCLLMTYLFAALFHNTTSILLSVTVTTLICKSYRIPVIPVLCGSLVASNLGGFSTRWGDTPNIVEAQTWGLAQTAFFQQILPVNLGALALLIVFVYLVVRWRSGRKQNEISNARVAFSMVEFRAVRRNTVIDHRLFAFGLAGICLAVLGSLYLPAYQVLISAAAIGLCILGEYSDHRSDTLFTLGIDTYGTLLAIFVIAHVVAESQIGIGGQLTSVLHDTHASVPSILVISYFGTLLTEAASWATAAAPIVHGLDSSSRAAWALGAGICAGSSSLITAASAGILLLRETADNDEGDRITFGQYLLTGLCFSAIMLIYYALILSIAFG